MNEQQLQQETQMEKESKQEKKAESEEMPSAVSENQNMVKVSEQEYKKLNEDLASFKDKYLRLLADFDNARKRFDRDKIEFVKYANEALLADFLNIVDDLERSTQAAKVKHEDYAAFLKGVEMIMGRIQEILKKNNVQPMEALGKIFDPHCHEILMMVESDKHADQEVIEVLQTGYYLGDRVLRTAKVKVAKQKEQS